MRKGEIKLSLFTDDIVIYVENLKELTEKLLKLISNCSKVAGCQDYIKNSITFLYVIKIWNSKLKTQYHSH